MQVSIKRRVVEYAREYSAFDAAEQITWHLRECPFTTAKIVAPITTPNLFLSKVIVIYRTLERVKDDCLDKSKR